MDLKDFRSRLKESGLPLKEKYRSILETHVIKNSDLSENALVSLVVLHNGECIDDDKYLKELEVFGYVNEKYEVTESGISFLEQPETIKKLKKIIEE